MIVGVIGLIRLIRPDLRPAKPREPACRSSAVSDMGDAASGLLIKVA